MMDANQLRGLRDEFEKIARTRYAQEAANAMRSGDMGSLNQIAQAHEQLGLGQREIMPLGGGTEAGAFANLGRAQGQTGGPNYHVEKFYHPLSSVTRGEHTNQMVGMKKQFTDAARNISPEARAMVPEMYGHSSKLQGTDFQRTRSTHEFVPGMGSTGAMSPHDRGTMLDQVDTHLLNPMKQQGMAMGDTSRETPSGTQRITNYGNVVPTAQGPKVVDFLPHQQGGKFAPGESFKEYAHGHDTEQTLRGGGPSSGYTQQQSVQNNSPQMTPQAAKSQFYNPTQAVAPASQEHQQAATQEWEGGLGRAHTPTFKTFDTPHYARQQAAAQTADAATPVQRMPNQNNAPTAAPRVQAQVSAPTRPVAPPMPTQHMPTAPNRLVGGLRKVLPNMLHP